MSDIPAKDTSSKQITQSCAITFMGNASNKRQQDAFFFLTDWFQVSLGITPTESIEDKFCLAVSDGLASSRMSQHCSKAVVAAIANLWLQQTPLTVTAINTLMVQTLQSKKNPSKYNGSGATLAMVIGEPNETGYNLKITHVGDSRVYLLKSGSDLWHCLTRDHNLLNELVDEQAEIKGQKADSESYNIEGLASFYNVLTEYFVFSTDSDSFENVPKGSTQYLNTQSGDCILICTDGIHDLVPSKDWHNIDETTNLEVWLLTLKTQVYQSKGNAYDNGTAVLVRFG